MHFTSSRAFVAGMCLLPAVALAAAGAAEARVPAGSSTALRSRPDAHVAQPKDVLTITPEIMRAILDDEEAMLKRKDSVARAQIKAQFVDAGNHKRDGACSALVTVVRSFSSHPPLCAHSGRARAPQAAVSRDRSRGGALTLSVFRGVSSSGFRRILN